MINAKESILIKFVKTISIKIAENSKLKMYLAKYEFEKFSKYSYNYFLLAGDIGGTNSSIGVFGIMNGIPKLIVSFSFKSKEIKDFPATINQVLNFVKKTYNTNVSKACFGVAGVVSPDNKQAKITKLNWHLSSKAIVKKTGLKQIIFINDFQAIGYGINLIEKNQFAVVKKGIKVPKSNILVVGAGTGLGKTLLIYDKNQKFYKPIASEAGHIDFPAQTEDEIKLIKFIKKYKKIKQNVSYEQVLSGPGLSNIYLFLKRSGKFDNTKYSKEIKNSSYNPEVISNYRKADKACKVTFEIFRDTYARFARDMALDGLSSGGVYIGGGIATKNKEVFDKQFIKIFEQSHDRAYILKKMPINLILDYNIGLLGAGFAGAKLLK